MQLWRMRLRSKYFTIACTAVIVSGVAFFLARKLIENREYVKVELSENRTGSFLLDIYQSVRKAGSAPPPAYFEANKISYSIFGDNSPAKESAAIRRTLPEFKVIPGLDAD